MTTAMEIDEEFKKSFAVLAKKYGDKFSIPHREVTAISELARAKHVALICNERNLGPLAKVLRDYGIPDEIIEQVAGCIPEPERKQKRGDKHKVILDWCDANPGKETTVYEVAEIGGVSYATANQLVKDRIDYFKKVKKGLYIIRNPKLERTEEKQ